MLTCQSLQNCLLAKQQRLLMHVPAPVGHTLPVEHGPRSTKLEGHGPDDSKIKALINLQTKKYTWAAHI